MRCNCINYSCSIFEVILEPHVYKQMIEFKVIENLIELKLLINFIQNQSFEKSIFNF